MMTVAFGSVAAERKSNDERYLLKWSLIDTIESRREGTALFQLNRSELWTKTIKVAAELVETMVSCIVSF